MNEPQELTSEQVEEQEQLEFEASFSGEPVKDVVEKKPEPEPEPVSEPVLFAGFSEDEIKVSLGEVSTLKDKLLKQQDTFNGTIGNLKQEIKELQSKSGGFSSKAYDALNEEFPELANILFENGKPEPQAPVVAPVVQAAPEPQVDYNAIIQEKMNEQNQKLELRMLKKEHPDYQEIVQKPEWAEWIKTFPVVEQELLVNSTDAEYCSSKIAAFKATQTTKIDKLSQAITPRSGVTPVYSSNDPDEEAFLSGYGKF